MVNFSCKECKNTYKEFQSLRRHVSLKHKNVIPPSQKDNKVFNFPCELCSAKFSFECNLKSHVSKVHMGEEIHLKKLKCTLCETLLTKNEFKEHMEANHDVVLNETNYQFTSFESFIKWKEELEKETVSKFSKIREKLVKKGKMHYFKCNRSGQFKSKSSGLRHLKKQGSCKMNEYCPASIKVLECENGTVDVSLNKTHVGHTQDLQHTYLSQSDKMNIAADLMNNVPFEKILDGIRDSVENGELSRIHLVEKKDLHNIEKEFNLNDSIKHQHDGTSVEAWVIQDKASDEPCVLYYKPQGIIDSMFPGLSERDFVLVLMNKFQKAVLEQFGSDCICMDGTHGLNPYDFEMVSVVVLDELRQGFPCCFLISNRTDQEVMSIFLSKIKDQVGTIQCKVFMSDMAESFYNAWIAVMGCAEKRLFCSWHVDRAWRKNLQMKIKNKEKQGEAYKMMRSILQQQDVDCFKTLFPVLLQKMLNDPDLKTFGEYISNHYGNNVESWALCFRSHCGLNTNMHIESMHRTLKHIYLQGKSVQRLDKTLHILQKFVRDKLFDRIIALTKGKISSKVSDIRRAHQESLSLDKDVITKDASGWIVPPHYHVKYSNISCSCKLVCSYCECCIHWYVCTCFDSSIKWNMCKHIHAVATKMKETEVSTFQEDTSTNTNNLISLKEVISNVSKEPVLSTETSLEEAKKQIEEKFKSIISTITNVEQLNLASKAASSLGASISAISHKTEKKKSTMNKTLEKKTSKNIDIQQRKLFSTKKKRAIKQSILAQPTSSETDDLNTTLIYSLL